MDVGSRRVRWAALAWRAGWGDGPSYAAGYAFSCRLGRCRGHRGGRRRGTARRAGGRAPRERGQERHGRAAGGDGRRRPRRACGGAQARRAGLADRAVAVRRRALSSWSATSRMPSRTSPTSWLSAAAAPAPDVVLVLTHAGRGERQGVAGHPDRARAPPVVECPKITRLADRMHVRAG